MLCILSFQTAIAEGASLAQSQHFDQLEALWNKRSPPRRRHNQVIHTYIYCLLLFDTGTKHDGLLIMYWFTAPLQTIILSGVTPRVFG